MIPSEKKLNVLLLLLFFINGGAGYLLFDNLSVNQEIVLFSDVLAETATAPVQSTCSTTGHLAFAPELLITVTEEASTRGTPGTSFTSSIGLTNPINSDTAPTTTTTFFTTGANDGMVLVTSKAPKMKVGGIGCVTVDRTSLRVTGGTDNAGLDVAIQQPSEADNAWNSAKKVDTVTDKDIFGPTSPLVATNLIFDNNDVEGITNGEIVMGGTSIDTVKGGYEMQFLVKVYAAAPNGGPNERQILTMTVNTE